MLSPASRALCVRLLSQAKKHHSIQLFVQSCMDQNDQPEPLVEGEDYYFEDGLMVLTARYHLRRGYCCEQGCRHCPYGFAKKDVGEDT